MHVTLVRGGDGRRMLAVQLVADVGPQTDNLFGAMAELRRVPSSDPRAAMIGVEPGDAASRVDAEVGDWSRLISVTHLLGWGVEEASGGWAPGMVPVRELLDPGVGERSIGISVRPGENPLPFLVDVDEAPSGAYLMTLGPRTVPVLIPPPDRPS